jgi:hypothetical protein
MTERSDARNAWIMAQQKMNAAAAALSAAAKEENAAWDTWKEASKKSEDGGLGTPIGLKAALDEIDRRRMAFPP